MQSSTITILGAGYVGLTTAALLARAGYRVHVVEPNQKRLKVIKTGKSFFFETGLDPIITAAINNGCLLPSDSYEDSVPSSDIVFSCVGTPDNTDGSSNLTYVFQAAEHASQLMKPGAIFVQKSTVPVGTGAKIEAAFKANSKQLQYVSNPEFLREGTALEDTLFFDRVVVGGNNTASVGTILELYRQLESKRETIAQLAHVSMHSNPGEYIATELASAELIKVTSNAFLAMKISFANSIALLADKTSADINQVMDAVGADHRIGRDFLNAGRGYGGGCFPKDVSGLISSGLEHGVDLAIMQATQAVNDDMPGYIAEKLQQEMGGSLSGKNIAVLGLAFKAGTSDVRRSPGIAIANLLQAAGANVTAYDPKANNEASNDLSNGVRLTTSIEECVKESQAIVVTTEWAEFRHLDAAEYARMTPARIILDAINQLPKVDFVAAGFRYLGVGR